MTSHISSFNWTKLSDKISGMGRVGIICAGGAGGGGVGDDDEGETVVEGGGVAAAAAAAGGESFLFRSISLGSINTQCVADAAAAAAGVG